MQGAGDDFEGEAASHGAGESSRGAEDAQRCDGADDPHGQRVPQGALLSSSSKQSLGSEVQSKSKLLLWKENDRAIITFKNRFEIEKAKADLSSIVNEWILRAK